MRVTQMVSWRQFRASLMVLPWALAFSSVAFGQGLDVLMSDAPECRKARELYSQRRYEEWNRQMALCRVKVSTSQAAAFRPPVAQASKEAPKPSSGVGPQTKRHGLFDPEYEEPSTPHPWAVKLPDSRALEYRPGGAVSPEDLRQNTIKAAAIRLVLLKYISTMSGATLDKIAQSKTGLGEKVRGYQQSLAHSGPLIMLANNHASTPEFQKQVLLVVVGPEFTQRYFERVALPVPTNTAKPQAPAAPVRAPAPALGTAPTQLAVGQPAVGGERTVFGFRLGESLALPPCNIAAMGMSALQATLRGETIDSLAGGGPSCAFVGFTQVKLLQALEPPKGLPAQLVQLSPAECPDWVARCLVAFSMDGDRALAATFNTVGTGRTSVKELLTRKYGAPTGSFTSSCTSGLVGEGNVWDLAGVRVERDAFASSTCSEGKVTIKLRELVEMGQARDASGPQL